MSGKTRCCKEDSTYLINHIFNANTKSFKFFHESSQTVKRMEVFHLNVHHCGVSDEAVE